MVYARSWADRSFPSAGQHHLTVMSEKCPKEDCEKSWFSDADYYSAVAFRLFQLLFKLLFFLYKLLNLLL